MRPPVDGGVVLITGASSGIGEALARRLAGRAATLVLVARRKDRLESLRDELVEAHRGLRVAVEPCDLGDRDATDAMLARVAAEVGDVDVLVNNAGLGDFSLFELSDWDRLRPMIEVNVTALAHLTHRLLPGMVARRKGGVLNVSSGFGVAFSPGFATYAGTKHFVTAFTESLRLEVKSRGVVVTQICPGPVASEFEQNVGNFTGRKVPSALEISADKCAKQALAAFDRNRALVIPGFVVKIFISMGMMSPRFLLRLFWTPVGWLVRRTQERAKVRT